MRPRRRWTSSEGLKHRFPFSPLLAVQASSDVLKLIWHHRKEGLIAFRLCSKRRVTFHTGLYPLHSVDVRTWSQAEEVAMPIGAPLTLLWVFEITYGILGDRRLPVRVLVTQSWNIVGSTHGGEQIE